MSLGDTISEARKKLGITQKQLAERIEKEDGKPITPQYLNDIEHDRRTPTAPQIIEQFASALELPAEVLYFQSGTLPADLVSDDTIPPERVIAAFDAFRIELGSKSSWLINSYEKIEIFYLFYTSFRW